MGLFSNTRAKGKVFSERDLVYNRRVLEEGIVKCSEDLYEMKDSPEHQAFAKYLRYKLNLEVLRLSESRDESEMSARRARIDALRDVLDTREKFIADKKMRREAKDHKGKADHESKRSFIKRTPGPRSAGLAI